MSRFSVGALSLVGFLAALVLVPVGSSMAAQAFSNWAPVADLPNNCAWGRTHVNNVEKNGTSTTKNTALLEGGCPGTQNWAVGAKAVSPGLLGNHTMILRSSTNHWCGGTGIIYNSSTTASLTTVTKITSTSSMCPKSSGAAYRSRGEYQRYVPATGITHHGSSNSPNLNFN